MFITGSKYRKSQGNLTVINAPVYDNRSYFSRFMTWLSYFIYTFFVLKRIKGKPVLIISSNPPFLSMIGYIYKKIRGWNYIVRILDVYPDAIVQNGLIKRTNPIYKIWGFLNRIMFKHAKHVITLGHVMAVNTSKYIVTPRKVEVIPDWVNVKQYIPMPKNKNWFLKKYFDLNNLTVIYSGNLGLTHDVKTLFEGIKLLKDQNDISFAIIGGGARKEEAIKQSNLLTNLKYLPFQSDDTLPFSLASADVAIICLGKGTEGISMPSKLYYSMASGCAILSISDGYNDLKYIVEKTNCGFNIENGNVEQFVSSILKFKNDSLFLHACKENSRKACLEYYSSDIVIPKYIKMVKKILINNTN